MKVDQNQIFQKQVSYSNLALAIYLEIAAHLEQISGVSVEILPQINSSFSYAHSQARGFILKYTLQLKAEEEQLIEAILNYYASLYGSYQISEKPL